MIQYGMQPRLSHLLTHEIDNAVCDAERTRSLDASADVFDIRLDLLPIIVRQPLELTKVAVREVREAGDHILSDQLLRRRHAALGRDLYLQLALSEPEIEHLDDAPVAAGGLCSVLGDLVLAGDAEVDAALADESGNVGGGKEDER